MITNYLSNSLPGLDSPYSLIIGLKPSNGARSPVVWNSYFKSAGINCIMHPADVDSEQDLNQLLHFLSQDTNFYGAAVAAPYKTAVFNSDLIKVDSLSAKSSQSVNCIYRGTDGSLFGTNTDALAFMKTLDELSLSTDKPIFLFGLGATGRAIACMLSQLYSVYAYNRTISPDLHNFCNINNINLLSELPSSLSNFQLVVNASIVGSAQFEFQHEYFLSRDIVETSPLDLCYYDINYTPETSVQATLFNLHGCKIFNGLLMNKLQAYIALSSDLNKPLAEILLHSQ